MKQTKAHIIQEYGPFHGAPIIHGVDYDGRHLWLATGDALQALDLADGEIAHTLKVAADAGTAFDGTHLYQIAEKQIQKIDPKTGEILATLPAPGNGEDSGMAWAEGSLWIGQYRNKKIHQVDADTGAILRTLHSDRFVTGVTWLNDQLWHGTWEGETSDLRHIDPDTGEVLESIGMPEGAGVSGLTNDGNGVFYCGGGPSGKVRAVARR
ncbi:NHL repeat-containing protein [Alloalcanivorax mobilis]|uniref:glutamine cyclotransferase n=1 Tax=Alloalcanivorax mobilis TaxID=2019569 RepID=UPI000C76D3C8|nr:glutamine cyclotransferase [Alloalcanivorax mobilis]